MAALQQNSTEVQLHMDSFSNRKACHLDKLSGKPLELTSSSGIINRLSN